MEIEMVDPKVIKIPAKYPRQAENKELVANIAQSMSEVGILNTPIVQKDPSGDYELVSGYLRIQAAILARAEKVPCRIMACQYPALVSLIENEQREDLDPLDKANAYATCIAERGSSNKSFAQEIGRSEASVSATLSLLKLPAEIIARHRKDRSLSGRQLIKIQTMGCLTDQLKAYEKALKQNCGGNAKKPRSEPELVLAKIAALQKSLEHFDLSRAQQRDTADIHDRLLSGVIKIPSTLAKVPGIAPKALFLEASRLILDLAEQSEDEASLRLYSQMINNVVRSMHEIRRRKIKLNFWQKVFRWI